MKQNQKQAKHPGQISGIVPCSKCGAMIRFITTKSRSQMPVEAEIDIIAFDQPRKVLILADGTTKKGVIAGDRGHEPHWGNCPGAAQFKKASDHAKAD